MTQGPLAGQAFGVLPWQRDFIEGAFAPSITDAGDRKSGIGNAWGKRAFEKRPLPWQHIEPLPSKRTLRHPQACEVSNDALREPSLPCLLYTSPSPRDS